MVDMAAGPSGGMGTSVVGMLATSAAIMAATPSMASATLGPITSATIITSAVITALAIIIALVTITASATTTSASESGSGWATRGGITARMVTPPTGTTDTAIATVPRSEPTTSARQGSLARRAHRPR